MTQAAAAPTVTNIDAVEEIKRYKKLLEEGIINEEEYAAKKKLLLGI